MGMVFRLMAFLIMFNLATGLVALMFGAQSSFVNSNTGLAQVGALQTSFATPAGVPVEDQSMWYRFMDIISIGFFNKIMVFINNTIFAVPTLLVSTGIIDPAVVPWLNGFITLTVIFGMFEIFTGRDLFGR